MALNDIKVPKENASGTFDEITLPDATTSARGLLTSADKTKLDGIASGAEVNVNADWNASSGDAQILNKPTSLTPTSHAASHAAAGSDPMAPSDIGLGATDDVTFNSATLNNLIVPNGMAGVDAPFNGLVRIFDELTTGSPTADFVANNNLSASRTYDLPDRSGELMIVGDAPASHTHPASAISDSTTAGRALLTGADAAAQRTSLGLGTAATSATSDFAAASHSHELTALAATGATNGHVLTANGSGGVTFAAASGGAGGGSTNLWIPASQWIPRTTTGCGVDSREQATNKVNTDELLFDTATEEYAQALILMPSNYNNSTVSARFYWTAASGSGGVAWGLRGRAYADDDAIDAAQGTGQVVTDTFITANDMHVTPATSAITLAGTPAANRPVQYEIYRVVSDAADTLGVDARLLGVEITFN